jgi:Uma2 family endonuclease
MTQSSILTPIIYPDSDGQPMADNTKQFNWIVRIKENLEILFANNSEVFVAGDLLWYPVEGNNTLRRAPDAMVAFGRPKGDRGSYKQWEEGGIAPQVVFEILSPGNRMGELMAKFQFYDRYGVEEYYIYDPDKIELSGWNRSVDELLEIPEMQGWVSPRLGIRFELGAELQLFFPDDQPFLSFLEIKQQAELAAQRASIQQERADSEQQRADSEQQRADSEQQRADSEQQRADSEQQRADSEQQRANSEQQRAESAESKARLMAAKLAELGIDADRLAP